MNRIKKITAYVLMFVVVLAGLPALRSQAAGKVSVSVSKSKVNIGESITVSATPAGPGGESAIGNVTFSYDSNMFSLSSCSEANYGGGGGTVSVASVDRVTITLTAKSAGSNTISVSASDIVGFADSTEYGDASGGVSVTVNNAASSGGGNSSSGSSGSSGGSGNSSSGSSGGSGSSSSGSSGNSGSSSSGSSGNTGSEGNGGEDIANKSGDNSLRSLTISPGKLSPAFKYSTTKYTASVPSDVTSVAVDAQVSNEKASVESVTGNNDLKPGDNTIKIVVKAENGTTATYTIVVNRGGEATEDPEETPEEDPEEIPETSIVVGEKSYKVSTAFPEDVNLPEEFVNATAVYGGEEVEIYTFSYGNLSLYYLTEVLPEGADAEQAAEGCFFYNESGNAFFPYINIPVGISYVIVLPGSYNSEGTVPEGYEAAQAAFGEFVMDGYQMSTVYTEGIEGAGDFYLVYAVNKDGVAGWYLYDSVDGSLQRYVQQGIVQPQEEEEELPVIDEEVYQKQLDELQEKYQKQKSKAHMWMCALIVVVVVAIIAIVNILIFGRGKRSHRGRDDDSGLDYIDFDDL